MVPSIQDGPFCPFVTNPFRIQHEQTTGLQDNPLRFLVQQPFFITEEGPFWPPVENPFGIRDEETSGLQQNPFRFAVQQPNLRQSEQAVTEDFSVCLAR
jgi:hypothetical protein